MKLVLNIKQGSEISNFLDLIRNKEYIEILEIKDDNDKTSSFHQDLIKKRLLKIEKGEETFKDWKLIKEKYQGKSV